MSTVEQKVDADSEHQILSRRRDSISRWGKSRPKMNHIFCCPFKRPKNDEVTRKADVSVEHSGTVLPCCTLFPFFGTWNPEIRTEALADASCQGSKRRSQFTDRGDPLLG